MPDAAARRASVVMPPGTGKTLVGLWALEAEARDGRVGAVAALFHPSWDIFLRVGRQSFPSCVHLPIERDFITRRSHRLAEVISYALLLVLVVGLVGRFLVLF